MDLRANKKGRPAMPGGLFLFRRDLPQVPLGSRLAYLLSFGLGGVDDLLAAGAFVGFSVYSVR